jgi:hypothetical protein
MPKTIAVASFASLLMPALAAAQATGVSQADVLAELRQLRSELTAARAELARLRGDVEQLKGGQPAAATALPPAVEMLQTQIAEHAQTKVESQSRLPLKIFGTVHSSVAANTGEANWLENPNIVAPTPATGTGSFSGTLRQTRLGIRGEGLAIGAWQGSGAVVFDFFGGIPAFQTGQAMGLPRLVYAFARFERAGHALHVGQDEMILAPRNPTSVAALAFPLLFRSGNLYLRVPQVRVEGRLAGDDTSQLRLSGGIVAPVGGDFRSPDYTFVPPALGGERSRRPGIQARLAWQRGDETRGASLGVSGHYSRERPATELVTSRAAAIDFHVQGGIVGIAGEIFSGDNLDAFGGALGQAADASGGFLEARIRPATRWEIVFGGGTDRPSGQVALTRNNSAFGSVTFRPTPEVAASFEYRWLETSAGPLRRRNNHFNWALTYGF